MKLTADTITDAQIRELRRLIVADDSVSSTDTDQLCNLAWIALDDGRLPFRTIREARARCAEIWNDRSSTSATEFDPTKKLG